MRQSARAAESFTDLADYVRSGAGWKSKLTLNQVYDHLLFFTLYV